MSIVEVMVAITLLAITMAATASSVVRALEVARDSRESVIGANVAQFELERLRSIPFVDWVTAAQSGVGNTTNTSQTFQGPDGQTYQVDRTATWIAAGATDDGCSTAAAGGGDGADYVRVTQRVTFPGRDDIEPIVNTTIITPRISDFDPTRGNLAVIVRDRDGRGAPGHVVHIQNVGVLSETTDDNGCAFFALLPADPATPAANVYDITIDTPYHVESALGVQRIEVQSTIAAQATTVREFEYDRAAAFDPIPAIPAPQIGCTMTLVNLGTPQAVDNLPTLAAAPDPSALAVDPEAPGPAYVPNRLAWQCLDGGVAVPDGWTVRLPANLAYTLYNPATNFSSLGRLGFYSSLTETAVPDTQARPGREMPLLFPYSDGYGIHAGRCPAADPGGFGGDLRILDAPPGTDEAADVGVALVTITSVNPNNAPDPITGLRTEPQRHVFADMRDDAGCTGGDRLYLGRTGTDSQLRALVPHGNWVFYTANAPAGPDSPPDTPMACSEATSAVACVQIRADGIITEAPATGVACPTPTYAFCGATVNSVDGYQITAGRYSDVH